MKCVLALALPASICLAAPANAETLFDFEEFPATSGAAFTPNWPGTLDSIVSVKDGISMTVTRQDALGQEGGHFDVHEWDGWGARPATWGHRSLSPFNDFSQRWFHFTFDTPLSSFSIEAGDYGVDSDTVYLYAYAGADYNSENVGFASLSYGLGTFPNDVALISALAPSGKTIGSVYVTGYNDDTNYNSLYFDNVRVNAVPEPASMAALGFGALGILKRRKRA